MFDDHQIVLLLARQSLLEDLAQAADEIQKIDTSLKAVEVQA